MTISSSLLSAGATSQVLFQENHASPWSGSSLKKSGQSLQKSTAGAFNSLSNPVGYADRLLRLTRYSINALVTSGKLLAAGYNKINRQLKTASSHIKALSIITLPGSLASVPSKIREIGQNFHRKDSEGTALAGIGFAFALGDICDTVATAATAVFDLVSRSAGFLETISLPLALGVVATKVALTSVHLFQLTKFKRELNQDVFKKIEKKDLSSDELRSILKVYLEKHLDLASPPDDSKDAKLRRQSNATTATKMRELAEIINKNEQLSAAQTDSIMRSLKDIKVSLHDETFFECGSLATGLVSGIAFSLFLTPMAPVAPFVILSINAVAQLALHYYKDSRQQQQKQEPITV